MIRSIRPTRIEPARMRAQACVVSLVAVGLVAAVFAFAAQARDADRTIQVYKTPSCGCCVKWIDHLREAGFVVQAENLPDLSALKAANGVPARLASCHTAMVEGYVIEGHVPAADVKRLLADRPENIDGLAVPGMPVGSPGMEGPNPQAYDVIAYDEEGQTSIYSRH